MTRGRKPKATAIKEREGAFKKNPNRRPTNEPTVSYKRPSAPPNVTADKVAHKKWKHICGLLEEMGIMSTADQELVEALCLNYSRITELEARLRKQGPSVVKVSGDVARNPDLVSLNQERSLQLKMLAELGLTPSSRSRIVAKPEQTTDPLLEMLHRRQSLN